MVEKWWKIPPFFWQKMTVENGEMFETEKGRECCRRIPFELTELSANDRGSAEVGDEEEEFCRLRLLLAVGRGNWNIGHTVGGWQDCGWHTNWPDRRDKRDEQRKGRAHWSAFSPSGHFLGALRAF